MGSGSRIDHQSHAIAPTATAPGVDPAQQAERIRQELLRAGALEDSEELLASLAEPRMPDDEARELVLQLGRDRDSALANETDPEERERLEAGRGTTLAWYLRNQQANSIAAFEAREASEAAERAAQAAEQTEPVPPAVARAAARDVLAEVAAESAASAAAQSAAAARGDAPDEQENERYAENMTAFQRDYRAARARLAAGEPAVEYMREDATGGLGARDGGRGFGVELEFDLPGMTGLETVRARNAIARDMHAAGLSRSADVGGYHVAQRQGYTDSPSGWTFESDSTVSGGEIVSPIMYDTPETWANLEQICGIIARHGGRATFRTGGHVHVSTGDYDHTVENHSRLMSTVAAYEDVYYRLGQNPDAEAHRGTRWCRPNHVPSEGYASVSQARNYNDGHHLAVNLESVRGAASDHVEFRMFDGSLNPAVIQTQIKVALGTVDAAFRQARLPEAPAGGQRHHLGEHRRAYGRRRQTGEAWRQSTAAFRSFADTVFSRPADRAQAASLFAATHWQRG